LPENPGVMSLLVTQVQFKPHAPFGFHVFTRVDARAELRSAASIDDEARKVTLTIDASVDGPPGAVEVDKIVFVPCPAPARAGATYWLVVKDSSGRIHFRDTVWNSRRSIAPSRTSTAEHAVSGRAVDR
jgi:hypothetical protein